MLKVSIDVNNIQAGKKYSSSSLALQLGIDKKTMKNNYN